MRCSLSRGAAADLATVSLQWLTPKKYTYWVSRWSQNSQWQQAIALATRIRAASTTHVLDVRSYGAELLACSRGARWTASLLLVEEMWTARLQLNPVIWSQVLASMASARHWREALSLLLEVETHSPDDATIVLYNSVIKSMGSRWCEAFSIWNRAHERRLQPTVITLNSLLSACSLSARWASSISLLYQDLVVSSDLVSLNSAIAACRNAGRWDVACFLFSQAGRHRGLTSKPVDIVTFNATASAYAAGQRWQRVLELYARMATDSVKPNTTTFNTIMTSCSNARRWPFALAVFNDLRESSCQGDIITFTSLLSAVETASFWRQAIRLYFHQLRAMGLKANLVANNSLLAACSAGRQWELVMQLGCGRDQRDHLHPRDALTYGILGNMLQRGGHWKLMLALLQQFAQPPKILLTLAAATCEKACHSWTPVARLKPCRLGAISTSDLKRCLPFEIACVKTVKQHVYLDEVLLAVVQHSVRVGNTWDIPVDMPAAASLPSVAVRESLSVADLSPREKIESK